MPMRSGIGGRVISRMLMGLLALGIALGGAAHSQASAPAAHPTGAFTPGNLVVVRIGNGTGSTPTSHVFLDEYTPAGVLVQSLPMPIVTNGNQARFVLSNLDVEGGLSRSVDGRYLTLLGYDAAPSATLIGSASATVNRIVARVNSQATIDTSTRLAGAFSGGSPRSATTDDGSRFWTSGYSNNMSSGIHLVPFGSSGASTQIVSAPNQSAYVNIFGDQLYLSAEFAPHKGVLTVGSGLPTSPVTPQLIAATGNLNGSVYDFVALDRSPSVAGIDTLYVVTVAASNNDGLRKYSFDGTTWTDRGALSVGRYLAIEAEVTDTGAARIYLVSGFAQNNSISTLLDTQAYNAPLGSPQVLPVTTAPTNTAFRGIAFAPVAGAPETSTMYIPFVAR